MEEITKTNNQKEEMGFTYAVLAEKTNLVKIGHSIEPQKRLRDLQIASPDVLSIIAIVVGRDKEQIWHNKFSELRSHGEWFKYKEPLVSFLKEFAVDNDDKKNEEKLVDMCNKIITQEEEIGNLKCLCRELGNGMKKICDVVTAMGFSDVPGFMVAYSCVERYEYDKDILDIKEPNMPTEETIRKIQNRR